MNDVVIVGAGPAGALAATILARRGLKVRLLDRARFPRPKLCGDTLNPGAIEVLRRHVSIDPLIVNSLPIHGMVLTGPGGVRVRGEYGGGTTGRSITRQVFDQWLVDQAVDAGAQFDDGVAIRDVTVHDGRITGVTATGRDGQSLVHSARIVIGADGRRSTLAIGRKLSAQPQRPRRWAIGGYFTHVGDMAPLGEMHVRRGHYIGVAPLPNGVTNACLVFEHRSGDGPIAPNEALHHVLGSDPLLKSRFERARAVDAPVMLGPMAVNAIAAGEPGLLLAGDAAGFIDPMTGDGMRFAFVGAELASGVAGEVLDGRLPIARAHVELARRRRAAFGAKWRFNRALRSLVASPLSVTAAAGAARALPFVFESMIRYAGDCGPAEAGPSQEHS